MHRIKKACTLKVFHTNCQTAIQFRFHSPKGKVCRTLKSLEESTYVMIEKVIKQFNITESREEEMQRQYSLIQEITVSTVI